MKHKLADKDKAHEVALSSMIAELTKVKAENKKHVETINKQVETIKKHVGTIDTLYSKIKKDAEQPQPVANSLEKQPKETALKTSHFIYQLLKAGSSKSSVDQHERFLSLIYTTLRSEYPLTEKEKTMMPRLQFQAIFTKIMEQVNQFSKNDVDFVIQKQKVEHPTFVQEKIKSDIFDTIEAFKEHFGIEEKTELNQKVVSNQLESLPG